ncbi:MAG: DUF3307 domain-containing protein [Patescibacteria group bacterium]
MVETIFALLIIYQLKHFLADFPLQGKYMLRKSEDGWSFFLPLFAHCGVHAGFTFGIVLGFTRSLAFSLALAAFDFIVHFVMDRVKAGKKYLGRFAPPGPYFWWSLGFDQMVHHLTHFAIIYAIISVLAFNHYIAM